MSNGGPKFNQSPSIPLIDEFQTYNKRGGLLTPKHETFFFFSLTPMSTRVKNFYQNKNRYSVAGHNDVHIGET